MALTPKTTPTVAALLRAANDQREAGHGALAAGNRRQADVHFRAAIAYVDQAWRVEQRGDDE